MSNIAKWPSLACGTWLHAGSDLCAAVAKLRRGAKAMRTRRWLKLSVPCLLYEEVDLFAASGDVAELQTSWAPLAGCQAPPSQPPASPVLRSIGSPCPQPALPDSFGHGFAAPAFPVRRLGVAVWARALAKPGYRPGNAHVPTGMKAMTPFRSLDDLLSAVKNIACGSVARSRGPGVVFHPAGRPGGGG